jgi:hypothetical protein
MRELILKKLPRRLKLVQNGSRGSEQYLEINNATADGYGKFLGSVRGL